jgi:hypothetical protein
MNLGKGAGEKEERSNADSSVGEFSKEETAEIIWKCRSFSPPTHPPRFCSALYSFGRIVRKLCKSTQKTILSLLSKVTLIGETGFEPATSASRRKNTLFL